MPDRIYTDEEVNEVLPGMALGMLSMCWKLDIADATQRLLKEGLNQSQVDKVVNEYKRLIEERTVKILYKNWRGEKAWRRFIPVGRAPELNVSPLHQGGSSDKPTWKLRVWDLDKNEERSYELTDMLGGEVHHKRDHDYSEVIG